MPDPVRPVGLDERSGGARRVVQERVRSKECGSAPMSGITMGTPCCITFPRIPSPLWYLPRAISSVRSSPHARRLVFGGRAGEGLTVERPWG